MPEQDTWFAIALTVAVLIGLVGTIFTVLIAYASSLLYKTVKLTDTIIENIQKLTDVYPKNANIMQAEETTRQFKEILLEHAEYAIHLTPDARHYLDQEKEIRIELDSTLNYFFKHADNLSMIVPTVSKNPNRLLHDIRKTKRYNRSLKQECTYLQQQNERIETLCESYSDCLNRLNIALAICIGKANS